MAHRHRIFSSHSIHYHQIDDMSTVKVNPHIPATVNALCHSMQANGFNFDFNLSNAAMMMFSAVVGCFQMKVEKMSYTSFTITVIEPITSKKSTITFSGTEADMAPMVELLFWINTLPCNNLGLFLNDPDEGLDTPSLVNGWGGFDYAEYFNNEPSWIVLLFAEAILSNCKEIQPEFLLHGLNAYGLTVDDIRAWSKKYRHLSRDIADVTDLWFENPKLKFKQCWEAAGQ